MNNNAMSFADVDALRVRLQQFLVDMGVAAKVTVTKYTYSPGGSVLYGAACEDDWCYDDYALTVVGATGIIDEFAEDFVRSLNDPAIRHHLADGKLVLMKVKNAK